VTFVAMCDLCGRDCLWRAELVAAMSGGESGNRSVSRPLCRCVEHRGSVVAA